jgi:drug/metabolite transporter (DMT)-like permease
MYCRGSGRRIGNFQLEPRNPQRWRGKLGRGLAAIGSCAFVALAIYSATHAAVAGAVVCLAFAVLWGSAAARDRPQAFKGGSVYRNHVIAFWVISALCLLITIVLLSGITNPDPASAATGAILGVIAAGMFARLAWRISHDSRSFEK